ncbi:class I SAM-dependent methyltransferase [Streptomyces sp. NPDC055078]
MPIIPPERADSAASEPHRARRTAESFGSDPERYDRARPRYPDALVERIVAASPGPDLLDVGIGTGIAARQFRAAGCRVLGVDADARMGAWARRHGLEVEVAAFESWDPARRTFDAVVSGQTWHWVDPVLGAAKAADALRPGGRLAVFWNAGRPSPDLAEAFAEVYRRALPDSLASRSWTAGPDGYAALCAKAADGIREAGAFDEPEQWRFDWERPFTRDEWLDQLPTTGGHHQLPPAESAKVLAGIGAAVDAVGGVFTMRYATMAVTAARSGAVPADAATPAPAPGRHP